ncbi:MAG: hypothetical protein WBW81_01980, partial [Methylocella sp.]
MRVIFSAAQRKKARQARASEQNPSYYVSRHSNAVQIAHYYLANAFTRRLSRETFRAAALACT